MKKLHVIIIVLILLGGGALAFFLLNGDDLSQNSEATNQTTSKESTIASNVTSASLKELIELGEDVRCTYEYSDEDANYSGEAFISNQQIRGSVQSDQDTEFANAEVLYNSEGVYIWDADTGEGFSIDGLNELTSENTDNKESLVNPTDNAGVNFDQEYPVDCQDWDADQSVFEVPGDVNFTSFSEIFEQLQQLNQQ